MQVELAFTSGDDESAANAPGVAACASAQAKNAIISLCLDSSILTTRHRFSTW